MGPLRFELRSEDPQSPRMARLPYGPALILFVQMAYLPYPAKKKYSLHFRKIFAIHRRN